MLWSVDEAANVLRFVDLWHTPRIEPSDFVEDSRGRAFAPGVGLVGRAWSANTAIWMPDVVTEPQFRRAKMAEKAGLHAAFAFPLRKGERTYGVVELFSGIIQPPDEELLDMAADLGLKIGTFVDRKRAEQALHDTEARLAEEAKLAEVARRVGDIGHDLKNLLMPIVTGASLLEQEIKECYSRLPADFTAALRPSYDMTQELVVMIRHGAERIHARVTEIADSVKGLNQPPQFAPCALATVTGGVYETLKVLADQRGVALRTEGLESLPAIQADEHRLFNALYNLANNAIPETPPGGSITIRGESDPASRTVMVSVIDTGRGMPREVKDSLFSYRAVSHKIGGTGLGTKIVKDIVEAHGGYITVESEVGKGTAFHLTLPIDGPRRAGPSHYGQQHVVRPG
jgi:signal transduction histidine kinase